MKNRLSLYNSSIHTYIEPKDKAKFRKIAFKNKKSVSEFNRYIILFIIKLDEMKRINSQKELTNQDIETILSYIRGNVL